MKQLYLTILCVAIGWSPSTVLFAQTASASFNTGTGGTLKLPNAAITTNSASGCSNNVTVNIPAGNIVTGVAVTYTMTSTTGKTEDQRSFLVCTTTNTAEASVAAGTGTGSGTVPYSRSGLSVATGSTATALTFELRSFEKLTVPALPNPVTVPTLIAYFQDLQQNFLNVVGNCDANKSQLDVGWTVTVSYAPNTPLPVTLTAFSGTPQYRKNVLQWITATEQNSGVFEVEFSVDGSKFDKISTVKAAGNSNAPRTYTATHLNPYGNKNYYRLKMIDLDGSFVYSNIVVILPQAAESFTVYPNPAQQAVYLSGEYLAGWQLDIYNSMGQQVRRYAPITESVIDVHDLNVGIYMLHFTKGDIDQTVRLSVVH